MKKAHPKPVPRVITTSRPLPLHHGRALHVGVVGHLGRLAQGGRERGGQVEIGPGLEELRVHGRARALLGDEVRCAEDDAAAHHAGEAAGDPVGLGERLDQGGERVHQSAVAVGRERVLGVDLDPVGHHGAALAQHRCFESGAPDIDGQGEGVLGGFVAWR